MYSLFIMIFLFPFIVGCSQGSNNISEPIVNNLTDTIILSQSIYIGNINTAIPNITVNTDTNLNKQYNYFLALVLLCQAD